MSQLLAGRTALVAGGARGIGRAMVERFAANGARGIVIDLPGVLEGAKLPDGFFGHAADVTDEESVALGFAAAAKQFGKLDIAVANAGLVPPWKAAAELDFEEWDKVFAVNTRGVGIVLKNAVPLMQTGGGSIIITASINVTKGAAKQIPYTASKHAVIGIVHTAALELGRHNIRVNAISPGPVLSEASRQRIRNRLKTGGPSEAEVEKTLASQSPMGRVTTEDDIAKVALFLASDLSSAVTGRDILVDSGMGIT